MGKVSVDVSISSEKRFQPISSTTNSTTSLGCQTLGDSFGRDNMVGTIVNFSKEYPQRILLSGGYWGGKELPSTGDSQTVNHAGVSQRPAHLFIFDEYGTKTNNAPFDSQQPPLLALLFIHIPVR